jgi:hypothetical protein
MLGRSRYKDPSAVSSMSVRCPIMAKACSTLVIICAGLHWPDVRNIPYLDSLPNRVYQILAEPIVFVLHEHKDVARSEECRRRLLPRGSRKAFKSMFSEHAFRVRRLEFRGSTSFRYHSTTPQSRNTLGDAVRRGEAATVYTLPVHMKCMVISAYLPRRKEWAGGRSGDRHVLDV